MDVVDIIENVDIVEYISQYVDLHEKNGEFWGLSPFREENTPSFSVRREACRFYDFSSGIGGNVVTFVSKYFNCSNHEACKKLVEYMGGDVDGGVIRKKLSTTSILKRLKKKRKISNNKGKSGTTFKPNCMDKYEKRDDKLEVWASEGISQEALDYFNVRYDAFSNRLVYPIKNSEGTIVNIGGRTLDKDFKAKGLKKYNYVANWGELDVIYGLFDNMKYILEKREIILFEGCKSVLIARSWGVMNTGAILTSHLNPNQMKILIKLGVNVVFALDKDVDIMADHNIEKLKRYVNVKYLYDFNNLLSDKDSPVDKGYGAFMQLYEDRRRLY